jgi:membrane protein
MFKLFKKISHFLNTHIWHVRINKLDRRRGFAVRQLRVMSLAVKGFNEDQCLVKASALTFYMLFSIVPILALLFAIAKGFGMQEKLETNLLERFGQYRDVLTQAFDYANKMLATTQGGVIAGVGVILLLYSVLKLLSSIEDNFNEIWQIKKGRTIIRKVTDYLAIMVFAPILIVASGAVSVFLKAQIDAGIEVVPWLGKIDFVGTFVLKLLSIFLMGGLFTFIYMVLPNTRVHFRSAIIAGIISAVAFDLLQWAYINFQVGVVRYNAIYGSFAALPLFLIWMQYSWFVVLFGAELSFAYQNVDHYELESEIQNISPRYRRVIALLVANLVVKNFIDGKTPLNAVQIAEKLDLPIRLARDVITDFTETGIFNEVKTPEEKDIAYQPAISEEKLTCKFILDKVDTKGVNDLPIHSTAELKAIDSLMKDFDEVVSKHKGNVLVKDIL